MLRTYRISLLILLATLNIPLGSAQFQQSYYTHETGTPRGENDLYLALRASGFFHNNEFFDTHIEGYTLPGDYLQPVLQYSKNEKLSVTGGVHLYRFHGNNRAVNVNPYFSINYKPFEDLRIALGSFNKGALLKLPEPLYEFERAFTDLTAEGIRIDYNGKRWQSISWLDWRTFIESGDPFREEFIFGHSGGLTLLNINNNRLKIPYYIIVEHKGGQINLRTEPVTTRADLGTGIEWLLEADLGIFESLMLKTDIYFEQPETQSDAGNAFLGYGELGGKIFSFGLGYFHEKNWESILGEPLFFSNGKFSPDPVQKYLLLKAGINRRLGENSSFVLRFEGYYDLQNMKMQYSYGVHIIVDEWIKILSREQKSARAY
jgi:hypothetical protein